MHLLNAVFKSIPSIFTGTFWASSFKSIFFTGVILTIFTLSIASLLSSRAFFETGWLESIADIFGIGVGIFIAWILLPAFIPIIASMFQDNLLNKLELKHYNLEKPTLESSHLKEDLWFIAKAIGLNLGLFMFSSIFVLYIVLYFLVNGYLLGNEFFRIVANRRSLPPTSNKLIDENKFTIYGAGILISFLVSTPILNLLAPLVAVILMMHIFHILKASK